MVDKLSRNSSGIWKYFGIAEEENATPEEHKHRASDKILCLLCFQESKLYVYKISTATGNLWRDLQKKHSIPLPKERITGATIRLKTPNGTELKFGEKCILENLGDEDATQLEITYIEPPQKVKADGTKSDCGDIYRDIGSIIIDEISKRPALYEWSPSEVGKKTKRDALWKEAYEALGRILEIDRLQKKWINIRHRYKKLQNLERTHADTTTESTDDLIDSINETFEEQPLAKNYKSNGNDFSDILLLRNSSTLRQNITKSDESATSETLNPLSAAETGIQNSLAGEAIEDMTEMEQNSRSIAVQTSPELTTTIYCPNAILDEFDLFGRFIAEKMRRLPRSYVDGMEIKIMALIRSESQ